MGKFLLLIAVALVVYALLRAGLKRRKNAGRQAARATDDMVRCAQCGVHLPRGESLVLRDRYFCCDEHRQRYDGGNG